MATIEELLAADRLIAAARTRAADLQPGDRVLFHKAPPGSIFCTIPVTGTVTEATDLRPTLLYPPSHFWRLRIAVDGGAETTFDVSSEFTGCWRADDDDAYWGPGDDDEPGPHHQPARRVARCDCGRDWPCPLAEPGETP